MSDQILLKFPADHADQRRFFLRESAKSAGNKNTVIENLLFRQEVLHHPQLFLSSIIDAERKVAVVRVKRK